MIKITWQNWNNESDSEEVANLEEAKAFVNDCLINDPIIIASVKIIDETKEYTFSVADGIQLVSTTVTWIDHNNKANEEILENSTDALRFVKEDLLGQPVVFKSIKIGEQSLKLVM